MSSIRKTAHDGLEGVLVPLGGVALPCHGVLSDLPHFPGNGFFAESFQEEFVAFHGDSPNLVVGNESVFQVPFSEVCLDVLPPQGDFAGSHLLVPVVLGNGLAEITAESGLGEREERLIGDEVLFADIKAVQSNPVGSAELASVDERLDVVEGGLVGGDDSAWPDAQQDSPFIPLVEWGAAEVGFITVPATPFDVEFVAKVEATDLLLQTGWLLCYSEDAPVTVVNS